MLRKRGKKQLRQWVKFKCYWFWLWWWWWWWQRWLQMIMGTCCRRVSCSLKARDQGNYPLIKEWFGGRIQLFMMVLTLVQVFLSLLVVKFFFVCLFVCLFVIDPIRLELIVSALSRLLFDYCTYHLLNMMSKFYMVMNMGVLLYG